MLVKLTCGVNFTTNFCAGFSYNLNNTGYPRGMIFWVKRCAKMLVKLIAAHFVVEQNVDIRWPAGANLTYSEVLHNNGWNLDISTGVFSPMKNGTFMFVLSGTALKTDSALSLITKSKGSENIFESAAGEFNLIQIPYEVSIYSQSRYR